MRKSIQFMTFYSHQDNLEERYKNNTIFWKFYEKLKLTNKSSQLELTAGLLLVLGRHVSILGVVC